MDWDRLYRAAMVGGIILILTMLAWCVLAALFMFLLYAGDWEFYGAFFLAWGFLAHFFYKTDHIDS